ncbi:hypothetical protein BSFA1_22080 [Burkholderia sp. SFA1]|nr:hypothetical protein BSFA1_22080 [Burkholderia sp. SFA1]
MITAGFLFLGGVAGFVFCIYSWAQVGVGNLPNGSLVRTLVTSGTAITIALQIGFTGFLSEVLEIEV